MIIVGLILAVIGVLANLGILITLGIILIVVGAALLLLSMLGGPTVGGRRWY